MFSCSFSSLCFASFFTGFEVVAGKRFRALLNVTAADESALGLEVVLVVVGFWVVIVVDCVVGFGVDWVVGASVFGLNNAIFKLPKKFKTNFSVEQLSPLHSLLFVASLTLSACFRFSAFSLVLVF